MVALMPFSSSTFRMRSGRVPGSFQRRIGLAAGLLLGGLLSSAAVAKDFDFGFENVATQAKRLAQHSYSSPQVDLPDALANLKFEQYIKIQYNAEHDLWRNDKLPFRLSFFHEGMQYNTPVKIHQITAHGVQDIKFNAADFNYGGNHFSADDLKGLQFAGFRVEVPDAKTKQWYQNLVFQGASYLRAIGQGQRFGLSARGLAVDTGAPTGEEFPYFTEFWIARPRNTDSALIIYALLDSPRMTGVYRYTLHPGTTAVIDVKARVYMRANVDKLGLAPLTGMFLFGPNQPPKTPDYRPALHDSEGLSVHAGDGQWFWRPLLDPRMLTISSFETVNPKGFGLMQRSHAFSDYEDLDDRYDLRPSGWVDVKGNWGPGRVELVEIPTPDETNDNIVAYWVPRQQPKPLQPFNYEYSLRFENTEQTLPQTLAHVTQTRYSEGTVKQDNLIRKPDGSEELLVDFAGANLDKLPVNAPVQAVVEPGQQVSLVEVKVVRNEAVGGYRLLLRFRRHTPDGVKPRPAKINAYLHLGDTTLSETWSYLLPVP